MVLQVDAESICAFTTFVFSPCIRCRFAKYFLANCGVVSHSVTKTSSFVSSEIKLDWCCRACHRVAREVANDAAFCTFFSYCRAMLLTGLLMFPTTPKAL